MNVSNRKCINRLAFRSMKSSRGRNVIATIAVALTALLFTALFTIIGSIVYGFEQSNFRQVGTCSHGEFKRLTLEQYDILKEDEAIKEYGLRRVAGIATGEEFLKHKAEISYCDENTVKWMFISPTKGRLPKENSNEAATDTKVLSLIGAKGEIGEEITLEIDVDGVIVKKNFTLCGIWESDEVAFASHVLIAESMVEEIVSQNKNPSIDGIFGSYGLDIMLKDSKNIETEMLAILERNGFQSTDRSADDYIDVGINWGYLSESMNSIDAGTAVAIAALLIIIMTAGYLIIFNVFRISVTNDIRHYGLLKTIGTTGKQIHRIVFIQAITLSAVGIPIGLVLGWFTGAVLAPVIINELNITNAGTSANPVIFVFSAVFALVTVLISCLKPARIAGRVSPVEALRYTESNGKATIRKSQKGVSLIGMAMANLGRSKGKTALTVTSLALSVALFSFTFIFANSFSMDKYLKNIKADFLISDASYFKYMWKTDAAIDDDVIEMLSSLEGVENGGVTYGLSVMPQVYTPEDFLRNELISYGYPSETLENYIDAAEKKNGLIAYTAQLYGMDDFILSKINLIDGDISKLSDGGKYIAAVVSTDDLGNANLDSTWLKIGDTVTLRHTDSRKYVNLDTGEISDDLPTDTMNIDLIIESHDEDYEVVALVNITHTLGYRFYSGTQFVMGKSRFIEDTKTEYPMYYAFDVADDKEESIEEYIAEFTENSVYDYDSKSGTAEEFNSFKRMFVIMGVALSGIVGLIGLLNFANTILTGIFARRRELSVLRSIGMTGKQLKTMLIYEGLFYTVVAVSVGLVLNILTIPASSVLEKMFWFCEYRFTALPIAITVPLFVIVGIALPLVTYKVFSKKTVVERLRESE